MDKRSLRFGLIIISVLLVIGTDATATDKKKVTISRPLILVPISEEKRQGKSWRRVLATYGGDPLPFKKGKVRKVSLAQEVSQSVEILFDPVLDCGDDPTSFVIAEDDNRSCGMPQEPGGAYDSGRSFYLMVHGSLTREATEQLVAGLTLTFKNSDPEIKQLISIQPEKVHWLSNDWFNGTLAHFFEFVGSFNSPSSDPKVSYQMIGFERALVAPFKKGKATLITRTADGKVLKETKEPLIWEYDMKKGLKLIGTDGKSEWTKPSYDKKTRNWKFHFHNRQFSYEEMGC